MGKWRIDRRCIAGMILGCGLLLLVSSLGARADWLSGWSFRRELTVEGCGQELMDHPVKVVFDSADTTLPDFEFAHAHPLGDDLRLTGADGLSLLDYWIETWSDSLQRGCLWVEMPVLPDSGQAVCYLYYGNEEATSRSEGDSVFLFYDGFENFEQRMNAPDSLGTPTYDGSGQAVHPDVVYFPEGWGSPNAYEYWMMMTPYPDGDENYENPSILASHDGIDWQVPPGVNNPLRSGGSGGFNCDPDMIFVDGQLRAYHCWAAGPGGDDSSRVITFSSSDGVNWSDTAHVLTVPNYLISPTVIFEDSTYTMWYVKSDHCWSDTSTVHRRTSTDGFQWGPEEQVQLARPGWVIWHLDVQRSDSAYVMLAAAYPRETSCLNTSLFRAESPDGLAWTMDPLPMLQPSLSGWDGDLIYRSSFFIEGDLLEGDLYRIWYSARRTDGIGGEEFWHIGYTEGTLEQFFQQGINNWDRVVGDAAGDTNRFRSGASSLLIGTGSHSEIYKYHSGQIDFSGWFYDGLDTTTQGDSWLTLYDSRHIIGLGVYVDISTSDYSLAYYLSGSWQGNPTGIPRTQGWHKLSIRVLPDSSQLWVDDVLAGHLDVLDPEDIERVELEGHGWFDDITVRDFVWPQPQVSAGAEQWPFGVVDLQAQRYGSSAVRLAWTPLPGATGYRVYRSANDPGAMPDTVFGATADTVWMDSTAILGDPAWNYYYLVRGWNGTMLSEDSGQVGVFQRSQVNTGPR